MRGHFYHVLTTDDRFGLRLTVLDSHTLCPLLTLGSKPQARELLGAARLIEARL